MVLYDSEALRKLDDFLPDRIFDAHVHLDDPCLIRGVPIHRDWPEWRDTGVYLDRMAPFFGSREVRLNFFIHVGVNGGWFNRDEERRFVKAQLDTWPDNVAEVVTLPGDDEDALRASLVHPRVVGFKCYHTFLHRPDSFQAAIGEFLPECAWALADRLGLCITLHMVRPAALSDPDNMAYIKAMAKRYPGAVLILAHAARAFAAWTGVEAVAELKELENVWFDLAAVCESPAIFQILHRIGTSRCMWGSDFPIAAVPGKCISLADGFYWINEKDLERFAAASPGSPVRPWSILTENLIAVRQACLMADLGPAAVEDIFYNNAARLFRREG